MLAIRYENRAVNLTLRYENMAINLKHRRENSENRAIDLTLRYENRVVNLTLRLDMKIWRSELKIRQLRIKRPLFSPLFLN